MTNVPFINKITNELSKRKLKSDVVANAILDIAVGNDRLDNLIANGVTQSDLESLTIGGLTTEQNEALGKINGLQASASEIDNNLKGSVSILDFGADKEGITNNDTAFAAAVASVAISGKKLIFPQGTYLYTVSPNWAVNKIQVEFIGTVRLRYKGVGNALIFDGGATTGSKYNVEFGYLNPPYVEAKKQLEVTEDEQNGVYVRAVHHSKIGANVRGCKSAALKGVFNVCNEYNIIASSNEGGWYDLNEPVNGIILDQRQTSERTSACTFINPIIEGVSGVGIWLKNAVQNQFRGGTSEGCGLQNVIVDSNSWSNTFDGIDLEVSAIGVGFEDNGRHNTWKGLYNDGDAKIGASAKSARIEQGLHNNITVALGARNTQLMGANYGIKGGLYTNEGTKTIAIGLYNITTALETAIDIPDFRINTGTIIKKHKWQSIALGAYAVPSALFVPVGITLTISNVEPGDTVNMATVTPLGSNYIQKVTITATNTIKCEFIQIAGTLASPFPSGVTVRVDIWGH